MSEQFTYSLKADLLVPPTQVESGFSRTVDVTNWHRALLVVQTLDGYLDPDGGGLAVYDWPAPAVAETIPNAVGSAEFDSAIELGRIDPADGGQGIKTIDVYRAGLSNPYMRFSWLLQPGAKLVAWIVRVGPGTSVPPSDGNDAKAEIIDLVA